MPSKNGKLIPIICKNIDECFTWKGPAVVVDVLRFSTTVCAILVTGKKNLRVYDKKEKAIEYKNTTFNLEFFSELDFENYFPKFDNSPYVALTQSNPNKDAVIITNAGAKTVLSLKKASDIFIGCFANFSAVTRHLNKFSGEVLLIPSSLFGPPHIEDSLCCDAFNGFLFGRTDSITTAMDKLKETNRPEEFLKSCPQTGYQDLALALAVDKFTTLPCAKIQGDYAVIENIISL
ncbi:MAG TPA: 2-phosphosulfolactate phosphatase [Elusimicrobiales bacterium]|nr:2-phosphosulfolactate phosphatase [Elusimicrobiales bacterium]